MSDFGKTTVPIRLLGEEWFTLLAHLTGRPLSKVGEHVRREATRKLGAQLNAALDIHKLVTKKGPPLCKRCGENLAYLPSSLCISCHGYNELDHHDQP
jgi:hypothetical protein